MKYLYHVQATDLRSPNLRRWCSRHGITTDKVTAGLT